MRVVLALLLIFLVACSSSQKPLQDILREELNSNIVITNEENLLTFYYSGYTRQELIPIISDIFEKHNIEKDSLWNSDSVATGIYVRQGNLLYSVFIYKEPTVIEIYWQEGYWSNF